MEFYEFPEESKVLPGNWTLPLGTDLKKTKEFQIYEGDVWVVTTPKSGTTWMQELAWLTMHDVNFERKKQKQ